MIKLIYPLVAVAFLAGCSGEKSPTEAEAKVVAGSTEAVEADIAENAADPVTASGKTVNIDAVKAAFTANCPDAKPVQNAICKVGDKPGEFRCNYALEGDNVFSMKQTVIAEDGDGWKLIDVPNHCVAQ